MMTEHDMTETIRAYWRSRGYSVKVEMRECVEKGPGGGIYKYHAIRSDMIGGLPRGYTGDREPVARAAA